MSGFDIADAARLVESIVISQGDYEQAHGLEDTLHLEALKAIAAGHPNPIALAKVAISTEGMDFARCCA